MLALAAPGGAGAHYKILRANSPTLATPVTSTSPGSGGGASGGSPAPKPKRKPARKPSEPTPRPAPSPAQREVTFLFTPHTGLVTEFHFANACSQTQIRVPRGMQVHNGAFSFTSSTITVFGLLDPVGRIAIGYARYVTPTCKSPLLLWSAKL